MGILKKYQSGGNIKPKSLTRAELESRGNKAREASTWGVYPKNSKSEDVKDMQRLLNRSGDTPIKVDGIWGPKSKEALERWYDLRNSN